MLHPSRQTCRSSASVELVCLIELCCDSKQACAIRVICLSSKKSRVAGSATHTGMCDAADLDAPQSGASRRHNLLTASAANIVHWLHGVCMLHAWREKCCGPQMRYSCIAQQPKHARDERADAPQVCAAGPIIMIHRHEVADEPEVKKEVRVMR
jgi:hypothetical protein